MTNLRRLTSDLRAGATFEELSPRFLELAHDVPSTVGELALLLSDDSLVETLINDGRETSTHFVWPIEPADPARPDGRCGLYLHEFKDAADMSAGYANTLHNHRYDFVTLTLTGGYEEQRLSTHARDFRPMLSRLDATGWTRSQAGSTIMVNASDFHRLRSIDDGTLTLVLKSPPRRKSSTSVDLVTGASREHTPVEISAHDLAQRVKALGGKSAE